MVLRGGQQGVSCCWGDGVAFEEGGLDPKAQVVKEQVGWEEQQEGEEEQEEACPPEGGSSCR